jgi:hypothetical protein
MYKDLKGIPLKLTQHKIELDTFITATHHTRYKMNPYYVVIVKDDIGKLFIFKYIQLVGEGEPIKSNDFFCQILYTMCKFHYSNGLNFCFWLLTCVT